MIGSRDLEQRIRFESACRSLTSADTFFTLTSRAWWQISEAWEPSRCRPDMN